MASHLTASTQNPSQRFRRREKHLASKKKADEWREIETFGGTIKCASMSTRPTR